MMSRITDIFLKNYDEAQLFTRQKAGFLLNLCLFLLAFVVVIILHTLYASAHDQLMNYSINPPLIMTEFFALLVIGGVICLIYAGYAPFAAHVLLMSLGILIFLAMLLDNTPNTCKLDTVALLLAILSMTPIVVSHSQNGILGYGAVCFLLIAGFLFLCAPQLELPTAVLREYLLENTIAIVFISTVAYNTFNINRRALQRAQWEITSRKLAEDDLILKNALLEAQTESSPDGILFVDATGHIVSYNHRFSEIWRIPPEILESESDERILLAMHDNLPQPGEYTNRVHYLYEHPKKSGQDEFTLVDGRCLERKSEPVEGPDGEYLGRIWYFRDITTRKQHEAALLTSEERYRRVVEEQSVMIERLSKSEAKLRERTEQYQRVISSIPSIFWQMDVDSDSNLQKFSCTETVENLLGLIPGEINNDVYKYLSYVHSEDRTHIIESLTRMIEHPGEKYYFEYRIRNAGGNYLWFYSNGASTINEDGLIQIFGVTEDITSKKLAQEETNKLEDQLRQAQKMESIGRLAGGIAHDFNNLLTAISGNIDLALLELQEHKNPQERLLAADKAADSAAGLTKQLLAFSRKQLIEPQVLDLNYVIEQIYKLITRVIGEDIELEVKTCQPICKIKADPGHIEQILINLVVNARDAMPQGGKLTISTSTTTLDESYCRNHTCVKPGKYVVLRVTDTGSGMDEDVMQHIFEPFFTTKPKGKGTGLGLATIYGAIMQHGGAIDVFSKPGHGTTFQLCFPSVEGEADHKTEHTAPAALAHGSETILLVEDEPQVLDFARDALMLMGYKVIAFTNAEDAMKKTHAIMDTIDLLMTDIVLPGMNGRLLSEELTAVNPYLKVLFTSGYTEDVIIHHGMQEKEIHFMDKPYTAFALAGKIREILDA